MFYRSLFALDHCNYLVHSVLHNFQDNSGKAKNKYNSTKLMDSLYHTTS